MDKEVKIHSVQKEVIKSQSKLDELMKLKTTLSSGSLSEASARVKKM
jgi:hypothetical protein